MVSGAGAESDFKYKTKSLFHTDYKCTADEVGGYVHSASGHNLVRFAESADFFLTHISNIPSRAIADTAEEFLYGTGKTEDELRGLLEAGLLEFEVGLFDVTEKGSYFIRTPNQDPNNIRTHTLSLCTAKGSQDDGLKSIYCHEDRKIFRFDGATKRFSFVYMGTWDEKTKNGDSSVFAFGTCEEYYR
jgi:hypothetical protein